MSPAAERALAEARGVCPGEHIRGAIHCDDPVRRQVLVREPHESPCCRRIAAALLRAEARGYENASVPDAARYFGWGTPPTLLTAAAELEGDP